MAATAFDNSPMTTIKLYGQLRQFGRSYDLAVRTPAEALKARKRSINPTFKLTT